MPQSTALKRLVLVASALASAALFVACGGGGGKAVVEGDTAKVEMVLHHGVPFIDNLQAASDQVGQRIYEVAQTNPQAKKVEVALKMSKDGMEDGYGKPWTEDRDMGTVRVTDLDEVRNSRTPATISSTRRFGRTSRPRSAR